MNRDVQSRAVGRDDLRSFVSSPSRYIGINVLVALLAMVALLVGFQLVYAGRIYPGVHALGMDLGGLTPEDARHALEQRLDESAGRPVSLQFEELQWTVMGGDLGLRREVQPVVDAAFELGREGNPFAQLLAQLTLWRSGRNLDPSGAMYDLEAQRVLLDRIASEVNQPVIDARFQIRPDALVDYNSAQVGRQLEIEPSRRRIQEALTRGGPQTVELVVTQVAPRVGNEMITEAKARADLILGTPLTVKFRDQQWNLDARAIARVLRVESAPDRRVRVEIDRGALQKLSEQMASEIDQEPQDARFAWAGGALEVLRPSKDGQKLDREATVELLASRLASDDRVLSLPVSVAPAIVRAEDRSKLGISTLIESARTNFASGLPPKKHNIQLAASRLNGVVVAPGAMFSFNKEVGSTSLDAGYQVGWGIAAGGSGGHQTVPSVAGGICQVATTLFQTVFWSGYQIEERNWHLYWIPSYTSRGIVGLDATVDEDSGLDFKFINTTENHLLIQSWIDASLNVNFALYGTRPSWQVKIESLPRTDVVEPEEGTLIQEEASLPKGQRIAVESAQAGFNTTVVRRVIDSDGDDRTLRMVSRYRPARNVIMVGTGGAAPNAPRVEGGNRPATGGTPTPGAATSSSGTPAAQATPRPTPPTAAATQAAAKPTAPPVQPTTAAPKPAVQPAQATTAPAKPTTGPTTAAKPTIQATPTRSR